MSYAIFRAPNYNLRLIFFFFLVFVYQLQGIFVSEVDSHSSAHGKLHPMDKVLDIDGVDCSKISLDDAQTALSNSGPIINIMVSRAK